MYIIIYSTLNLSDVENVTQKIYWFFSLLNIWLWIDPMLIICGNMLTILPIYPQNKNKSLTEVMWFKKTKYIHSKIFLVQTQAEPEKITGPVF